MYDLRQELRACAKFKARSFETSAGVHVRLLERYTGKPGVVLLGDSLIERMTTTGANPSFQPWPSDTMLDKAPILASGTDEGRSTNTRLDNVFNAGVGGDRYENILYRLVGDDSEARPLPGLSEMLQDRDIKLWVIHAGTNNLHPKRGLTDADVHKLRLLLQEVLQISAPGAKLFLTGLFYRRDIVDPLIDDANRKLEILAASMNRSLETTSILFYPAPRTITKDRHLEDHVHLNVEGYRVWMRHLFPAVLGTLRAAGYFSGEGGGGVRGASPHPVGPIR